MVKAAKASADEKRRELTAELENAYHVDNHADFYSVMEDVFARPEEKHSMQLALVRKYGDTKAQVFANDPTVTINGESGDPSEPDQKLWDALAEVGNFWEELAFANAMEKVLGSGHIMVRPVDGYMALEFISPACTMVWQNENNPRRADAIAYRLSDQTEAIGVARRETWVFWSDDEHFTFELDSEGGMKRIIDPNNPKALNPLGMIPMVRVCDGRTKDNEYWKGGVRDVLQLEHGINLELTAHAHGVLNQGFTQTYSSGYPDHLFDNRGPDTHVAVNGVKEGDPNPVMGALQLHAQLNEMAQSIEGHLRMLAQTRDLPVSEFTSNKTAPESGRAKWVERAPLRAEVNKDRSRWRRLFPELFYVLRIYHNYALSAGLVDATLFGRFTENIAARIDFSEPEMMESETERLGRQEAEVKGGYKSKVDVLMENNPDFTRDEATSWLVRVREEQAQLKPTSSLAGAFLPDPNGE